MKPPRILIRTDATARIGMGHLSRCLTLARALDRRGASTLFAMAGPSELVRRKVASAGAGLAALPAGVEPGRDLELTLELARREKACGVVLDGYQFDQTYYHGLAQRACTLLFDEMAGFRYTGDVVLNQNLHAAELRYRAEPDTRLLLGPRYAVLRPEFAAARRAREHRGRARRLFVNFGGSDPHGLTARALAGLAMTPGPFEVRAVVGGESPHAGLVQELAAASPHQVEVLREVGDMASVMAWAEMALSASGTNTTLEMSCLGLPMVLVIQAENQRLIGEAMARHGLALQLGFWDRVDEGAMGRGVERLAADAGLRAGMSRRAMAAVDGRGAGRVADALLEACG
jgi:UDP-2,4-diacetamido-2,4,6-trideoxy-beta-L-altropyranose hydrolase